MAYPCPRYGQDSFRAKHHRVGPETPTAPQEPPREAVEQIELSLRDSAKVSRLRLRSQRGTTNSPNNGVRTHAVPNQGTTMSATDLAAQLTTIIGQAPLPALDDLSRDVWKAHGANLLTDNEAQGLAEAIQNRRAPYRDRGSAQIPSAMAVEGSGTAIFKPSRSWSYFPTKRPQRSPDVRQSLERRRTLAATAPLPPKLACKFTTAELAVLKIVADAVVAKGICDLSIPELAARAGVGVTKVRTALRIADGLGLLTIQERRVPYRPNLPNVIRIVSREWLSWMANWKPRTLSPGLRKSGSGYLELGRTQGGDTRHQRQGSLLRSPRNQGFTKREKAFS